MLLFYASVQFLWTLDSLLLNVSPLSIDLPTVWKLFWPRITSAVYFPSLYSLPYDQFPNLSNYLCHHSFMPNRLPSTASSNPGNFIRFLRVLWWMCSLSLISTPIDCNWLLLSPFPLDPVPPFHPSLFLDRAIVEDLCESDWVDLWCRLAV